MASLTLSSPLTSNLLLLSRTALRGCAPHPGYLRLRGTFTDKLRLDRLQSILAEAYDGSRQRGIRLVVAFAPLKHRVHQGLENFEPLTEAMREWPLNDMPNEVESMLRALTTEIEFVDLTLSLREAAARGGLTYLPDDTHWAAERQRVAGEAIHHLLAGRPTRLAKQ